MHPLLRWLVYPIATGLGAGYVPKAPGTFGTLVGAIAAWFAWPHLSIWGRAIAIGVTVVVGTLCASAMERDLAKHDPQCVVIDEIAGVALTLWAVDVRLWQFGLGFVLFRLFDIWKPWLIGHAGKLPGGVGVMADDIVAGFVALACMTPILRWMT